MIRNFDTKIEATKSNKSTLKIEVSPSDSIIEIFFNAISQLNLGDIIEVVVALPHGVSVSTEARILADLDTVARELDFSRKSGPYNGLNPLVYCYRGDGLPTGVKLAYSSKYSMETMQLFQEVFNQPMSPKFWRWKYENGFADTSPVLVKGGEVVAHYGVIPRLLWFMGGIYTGLQACDVMVNKSSRGGISSSYFALVFKYVLKQFNILVGQSTSSPSICMFGFPHGRHMLLGERLNEYKNLGNLYDVFISPKSFSKIKTTVNSGFSLVSDKAVLKPAWTKAWSAMSGSDNEVFIGVRDWIYGCRRYLYHPDIEYDFFVLNDKVPAVLVVKRVEASKMALIDFIGPIEKFADTVCHFYGFLLKNDSNVRLNFWQLEYHANSFARFATLKRTKAALAARFDGDMSFLENERWWIMMGDTDFL